jgi:hypothetical protein
MQVALDAVALAVLAQFVSSGPEPLAHSHQLALAIFNQE